MTTLTLLWAAQSAVAARALAISERRTPGVHLFGALAVLAVAPLAALLSLRGFVFALVILSGLLCPLAVRVLAPDALWRRRLADYCFVGALLLALLYWDRW
ncbi:hypothetical protein [Streptomyces sp. NPDC001404]|uniref:hypothetical protein n=1 Tax=Streptomyces sp. NPDC001404 TaxID=3364571 RepID=UPI0036BBB29C